MYLDHLQVTMYSIYGNATTLTSDYLVNIGRLATEAV
jgi:hypothetical protein